jgi:hypothetical protein
MAFVVVTVVVVVVVAVPVAFVVVVASAAALAASAAAVVFADVFGFCWLLLCVDIISGGGGSSDGRCRAAVWLQRGAHARRYQPAEPASERNCVCVCVCVGVRSQGRAFSPQSCRYCSRRNTTRWCAPSGPGCCSLSRGGQQAAAIHRPRTTGTPRNANANASLSRASPPQVKPTFRGAMTTRAAHGRSHRNQAQAQKKGNKLEIK